MTDNYAIVYPVQASAQEKLAAREIRRYVYLRTGRLLPLLAADEPPAGFSGYAVSHAGEEGQHYRLAPESTPSGGSWLRVSGGREGGVLYAAYRTAEHLGVRFALHGDIVPDARIPFALPQIEETGAPRFELRGILPFHDFPEGPDWWTEDDYKSVLAQLPKLRMNFFGLHVYPEKQHDPLSYNAEPGVWIGLPEEAGDAEDGVAASYPTRHFTTASEVWGFAPQRTADYSDGAAELFDRDDYGAAYMREMTPWPPDARAENELFDRFGRLLGSAFAYAKRFGIRTCIGTESPLTVPEAVRRRLAAAGLDPDDPATVRRLYEGMFTRIGRTHALDYYWLWTPEDWTWRGNTEAHAEAVLRDMQTAASAAEAVGAAFTLATCGWVLGPQQDRTLYDRMLPAHMPFSCINRQLGFEFVDEGFRTLQSRPGWAIPWMEDDPAMILPQLWAGRMRRDAEDAAAYGCSGLMGIHWRTKVIDPTIAALAAAGWEQRGAGREDDGRGQGTGAGESGSAGEHRPEGFIGGRAVRLPALPAAGVSGADSEGEDRGASAGDIGETGCGDGQGDASEGESEYRDANVSGAGEAGQSAASLEPAMAAGGSAAHSLHSAGGEVAALYGTARVGLDGYRLLVPNGTYSVTLKLREWAHGTKGERVFNVSVYSQAEARAVSRTVDIVEAAGPDTPWELVIPDVLVIDGTLSLTFRALAGEACVCAIEVAGQTADVNQFKGYAYYRAINCGGDTVAGFEADPPELNERKRNLPVFDFYLDWAGSRFGPEAAEEIAGVFEAVDGQLPRPVVWGTGPGSTITPDRSPWEVVSRSYAFLDRLEAVSDRVRGAGGRERFAYWLSQFRYLRSISRIGCELGVYEAAMEQVTAEAEPEVRRALAEELLLPLRIRLLPLLAEMNRHLLATVSTPGELGTVANVQQQAMHKLVHESGRVLEELLGRPLPSEAWPTKAYAGAPRMIVPTVRTNLDPGEALTLQVLFLGVQPERAVLSWRLLGEEDYRAVPLRHESRGVYRATVPAGEDDFEYFIEEPDSGLRFPATAPTINQTVVRMQT